MPREGLVPSVYLGWPWRAMEMMLFPSTKFPQQESEESAHFAHCLHLPSPPCCSSALGSQRRSAKLPRTLLQPALLLHLRDGVSSSGKALHPGLVTLQPWRTLSFQ